jgi:hypothetical protein
MGTPANQKAARRTDKRLRVEGADRRSPLLNWVRRPRRVLGWATPAEAFGIAEPKPMLLASA